MKKFMAIPFAVALVMIVLIACAKEPAPDSPVIAKVGKSVITEKDFVREMNRVPEWARQQFTGEEGKEKFLEELVKRELLYQEAVKMRLNKDQEYVDRVKEFEKMTLVSFILKKELEDKAVVSDAEVKAFFDQNAEKLTVGTKLRASHILVETEEEAKQAVERIKTGEDFSSLARSLSKDKASAQKGGDLGFFGKGKMVPEFERAASSLKPGEVSDPVRTRFGYHIIKLTDIQKGESASFDQSKESIKRQLLAERKKGLFESFIDNLKGKSEITKDEGALAKLTLPWEQEQVKPAPQAQN